MAANIVTSVRLNVYAARVRVADHTVLQYNRDTDRLGVWEWPSSTEARVHPSELRNHRLSHRMLGPCCLCPLADNNGPDFVEAAIYVVSTGALSGEYVASCALRKCAYFVFMERLYNKVGLLIKCYPRREFRERVPPQVTHPSELEQLQRPFLRAGPLRPLKRSFAMLDIEGSAPTHRVSTRRSGQKTAAELLTRVDARVQPGITDAEFSVLFCRCECGLVTTRRAFGNHECIIDLSGDD